MADTFFGSTLYNYGESSLDNINFDDLLAPGVDTSHRSASPDFGELDAWSSKPHVPSEPVWAVMPTPLVDVDNTTHNDSSVPPVHPPPTSSSLFGSFLKNTFLPRAGLQINPGARPTPKPVSFPLSSSPPIAAFPNFSFCSESPSEGLAGGLEAEKPAGQFVITRTEALPRSSESWLSALTSNIKLEDIEGPPPQRAVSFASAQPQMHCYTDMDLEDASDKLEAVKITDCSYLDMPDVFTSEAGNSASSFPKLEGDFGGDCAGPFPMDGAFEQEDGSDDDENVRGCGCLSDDDDGEVTVMEDGEGLRLRCKYGEFPIERKVFLWQRELGIVTCSAEEGIVEVSQRTISRRADLQHIRCHYCVNGPNLMQKRSKWLTKCRRVGCNGWYCQTHYPMYSNVPALDKSRSTLAELKALQHVPFICRSDRGLCCCSPANKLCANPQNKMCATFGKKSHKCEKVRHRVYNATKRKKNKQRKENDEDDDLEVFKTEPGFGGFNVKRASCQLSESQMPSRKRQRLAALDE